VKRPLPCRVSVPSIGEAFYLRFVGPIGQVLHRRSFCTACLLMSTFFLPSKSCHYFTGLLFRATLLGPSVFHGLTHYRLVTRVLHWLWRRVTRVLESVRRFFRFSSSSRHCSTLSAATYWPLVALRLFLIAQVLIPFSCLHPTLTVCFLILTPLRLFRLVRPHFLAWRGFDHRFIFLCLSNLRMRFFYPSSHHGGCMRATLPPRLSVFVSVPHPNLRLFPF